VIHQHAERPVGYRVSAVPHRRAGAWRAPGPVAVGGPRRAGVL